MKGFYRQRECEQGCHPGHKGWLVIASYSPLGVAGVYQADGLTSADQAIPDGQFLLQVN